ncbi:MAG: radical SAM protein, partial [Desulfobacterales bacterium]|nr:radical SAM protein [Desulfobacterales bacterium]
MHQDDIALNITFKNSGETREVALSELVERFTDALENFCEKSIVGREMHAVMGSGDGAAKRRRLMDAAGCQGDPEGFFSTILRLLGEADGSEEIRVNGAPMPLPGLMAILEQVLPGDKFVSIKDVDQLEKLTNITVPGAERADMQEVLDTYPVRLSMHTIRQMRVSGHVAYQYLPFKEELDQVGHTNTWIGQFHQGLLEQMYQNRVIFLLNMSCPVYCRFCFRKHKESRNEKNPTRAGIRKAAAHVRDSPAIKEIVITGGDPFMSRENMDGAVEELMEIPHVRTLRLATRSIAYYPHLFLGRDGEYLTWIKEKSLALQRKGKRMEVATHFIHPDEISPESLDIISDLVRNGVAVYIQTPFLKDCNDKGPELVRLFSLLRGAGAEIHYIYIPCSPIHGNRIYWSPISSGIGAASHLRAHLSDRAIPRICTATPIGKMDWGTSGWAVEPDPGNDNLIWIRTSYTPGYFKRFAPLAARLNNMRVNAEGTIDIQYFAKIGDPSLFLGSRPAAPAAGAEPRTDRYAMESLRDSVLEDQRSRVTITPTGSPHLFRQHETRVELTTGAAEADFQYIRADDRITDVIVSSKRDVVESLGDVSRVVERLAGIPHVNAVRARSGMFNFYPDKYTRAVIDRLARLNRPSIGRPLRLEIETRFFRAGEIRDAHDRLVRKLNNRGITVYNNTPLLSGVNDTPDAIHELAFRLRRAGIEFHHLYV